MNYLKKKVYSDVFVISVLKVDILIILMVLCLFIWLIGFRLYNKCNVKENTCHSQQKQIRF